MALRNAWALALGILIAFAAGAEPEVELEELALWRGHVEAIEARDLEPDAGFVNTSADWSQLWSEWHGGTVPPVDFAREVVVVMTALGPNEIRPRFRLTQDGDLQVSARPGAAGRASASHSRCFRRTRSSRSEVSPSSEAPL